MKKNRMMRLASGLLVAVLLSTCAISGTFAKYITSDAASDTARVAKFGVVVTASGSLFDTTYKTTENTPGAGATDPDGTILSVTSSNSDKLVAPGTKNDTGLTFAITGTPEVDVKIDVVVTQADGTVADLKEVFLAKTDDEKLPDMTTGNATDKFKNEADYYPVKFTLKQTKNGATTTLVDAGRLSAVKQKLQGLTDGHIDANTDLSKEIGTLNLTWEWDFDNSGAGTYDKQDTLLGALAADTTLTPATTLVSGTDYNLNTGIKIAITVTQID